MRTILAVTAVLLVALTPAAEAKTVRGSSHSETLRGSARADVIKGKGGKTPVNPQVTPASRWEPILFGYWFQYEDFPALYRFRADHTGVRTTYPTGSLSFGTPYGFSWKAAGDVVTLTFPSGYVDQVTLAAYDSGRDFLTRSSSSTGVGAWYGCRSGQIPNIIAYALCT